MKIQLYQRLSNYIMGQRPYHTVCAFNYHNIRPIVRYMERWSQHMQPDGVLLDVGAGHSPYYEIFRSKAGKYLAVDIAGALPALEQRSITQLTGQAESLPVDDTTVDVVICNQVLEHVLDERQAVQESWRVLRNGGLFIGSVPHISPVHLEPYDFRRFTEYGLRKLLQDHGFTVLDIEGSGGVFRAMAMTLLMDLYLSKVKDGQGQHFHAKLHNVLFAFNATVNTLALVLDSIAGNTYRSPSNYCWAAVKTLSPRIHSSSGV